MIEWPSGKQKNKPLIIHFGPAIVNVDPKDFGPGRIFIQNTEQNLEWSKKNGINPISLGEIMQQVGEEDLPNSVLFDTPGSAGLIGNHWRILRLKTDNGVGAADLQLCGPHAVYDCDFPPVDVSLSWSMFTGIYIMKWELAGQAVSLDQVAEYFQNNSELGPLELKEEKVLWSNVGKVLVDSSEL